MPNQVVAEVRQNQCNLFFKEGMARCDNHIPVPILIAPMCLLTFAAARAAAQNSVHRVRIASMIVALGVGFMGFIAYSAKKNEQCDQDLMRWYDRYCATGHPDKGPTLPIPPTMGGAEAE
jgi:hypothetical protein